MLLYKSKFNLHFMQSGDFFCLLICSDFVFCPLIMHSDCGLLEGVLLLLISNFSLVLINFCVSLCPSVSKKNCLCLFNGLISTREVLLTWSNVILGVPLFK